MSGFYAVMTSLAQTLMVTTLAAAYGEMGRFAEAIDTVEMAVRLSLHADEREMAGINRQLLSLYRAGKARPEQPRVPKFET